MRCGCMYEAWHVLCCRQDRDFTSAVELFQVDESILQRQAHDHEDLLTSQEEQPEALEENGEEPPADFVFDQSDASLSLSLS